MNEWNLIGGTTVEERDTLTTRNSLSFGRRETERLEKKRAHSRHAGGDSRDGGELLVPPVKILVFFIQLVNGSLQCSVFNSYQFLSYTFSDISTKRPIFLIKALTPTKFFTVFFIKVSKMKR